MKKKILLFSLFLILSPITVAKNADEKAEALFEEVFKSSLDRSPEFQARLGYKTNYDKWDDKTDDFAKETHKLNMAFLKRAKKINSKKLSDDNKVSLQLLKMELSTSIENHKWRDYVYPVNQMFGRHTTIPSVLINQHSIANVQQAKDYITRVNGVPEQIDQLITSLDRQSKKGIIAPKFVFPYVIQASNNLIKGAPYDDGPDSAIFADFKKKVGKLDIDQKKKDQLIKEASKALRDSFKTSYQNLVAFLTELEKKADNRAGAWKFPKGDEFYGAALKRTTTTSMTADEIYELGLKEVDRIHSEMKDIMVKVKFKGSLSDFFDHLETDKQFYYPNTDEGREAYRKEATDAINSMKGRLDELFLVKPKADMIVKRVEPYREKFAGAAFYNAPALDGSRPGYYYINLYNMANLPKYELEALAFHEGLPGHHMQIAISQELEGIPEFRKHNFYTAYIEGWGLYSELLPKEIGFYKDPYSDFGRLSMELMRACRLVTDTGLHAKKWTKEKAIQYLLDTMPISESDAKKAIERYIVMPSQATAYKIGMIKILDLRAKAKSKLGNKFDIRGFHDVVLKNGPVPLNVLEQFVDRWIAEELAK